MFFFITKKFLDLEVVLGCFFQKMAVMHYLAFDFAGIFTRLTCSVGKRALATHQGT